MDPLTRLRELATQQARINQERDPLVVAARAQGHTWTTIGEAMGLTRQAAKNAYAKEQTQSGPARIATDG